MKRTIALILIILFALAGAASGETDARVAELEERVAELEGLLADREAEIEILRSTIDQLTAGTADSAPADAAATYNGGFISAEDARAEYEYSAYYYESLGLDPAQYADVIKQEVLENLVEDAILIAKAKELGVYETSKAERAEMRAEAERVYNEQVDYYLGYRYVEGKTDEEIRADTEAYLEGEGYTPETVLESLTAQVWRDKLFDAVTGEIAMTEEDLAAYYAAEVDAAELKYSANPADYDADRAYGELVLWNPPGYRAVKWILVAFDDAAKAEYAALDARLGGADEAEREAILAEMDALYGRLEPIVEEVYDRVAAGDDFQLLIDEYGADEGMKTEPGASQGFYIGAQTQIYGDVLRDAALAIESVGGVSDPVRAEAGVYVISYIADVAPGAVPFDEIHDWLMEYAEISMREAAYNEAVEKWLRDANIQYFPDRI